MSHRTVARSFDRREVIHGFASLAAAGALAPLAANGQSAGSASVSSIGEGLSLISGLGGNVVVKVDDGGAIVVDAGAAAFGDSLIETIDELVGSRNVDTLFNTHWHLDQVGSNAAFRERGANIVAHAKTLARLSTPYYLPDEDRYQPAMPEAAHPTIGFYTDGVIDGRSVSYGYLLEAHTDGDIYVQFENDQLIAAGDAISPLRDPELDWYGGGWLGGRVDSLKRLLDISDSTTRFVPSYGPVVDRDYVQAEHDLMRGLFDLMFERVRAGESAADIHRSGALDSLPRRFDDPARLLYAAHKSMWGHYNTLSHDIV